MNWLDKMERLIGERVSGLAKSAAGAPRQRSLIEVSKDIQEDLRNRIVAQDRGIRIFPYNRVDIVVFAKDDEQKAAYDAVLTGEDGFGARIREMLAEEGCRPRELQVEVLVSLDAEAPEPYHLRCSAAKAQPAAPAAATRPRVRLTVLRGAADPPELVSARERINLGRMKEVTSTSGAVIRVNDLAFDEAETTVAREHAYLRWEAGRCLLFDAISGSRGTSLYRDGKSMLLPKGASKGTALRDGDEIHIGQARIRFDLLPD